MKNSVIAIPSQYVVIMTIIYALLAIIFFDRENAFGEKPLLLTMIRL